MRKLIIFTIGHSTRPIEDFIELLIIYGIEEVVDVRTMPMSRHNPQYNTEELNASLKDENIRYKHIEKLGGLRHSKKDSINLGWHNTSFRGFADYMASLEFSEGLDELIEIANAKVTAIMCAEAVPWRCHRSLIADALTKKGLSVSDIMSRTKVTKHRLTPFLKIRKGQITYPELECKVSC